MKNKIIFSFLIVCLLCGSIKANPYYDLDEIDDQTTDLKGNYHYGGADNYVQDILQNTVDKRACVRRGGNCDHRPNDCCFNSSCRCNLWGSNCRCQRMGLFQKWG
uniref:Putative u8-agatoxin-ao1a-like protein n=1 Tax=Corethrella appendiculata TaxID=1370023 RepID=U5EQ61_9DIPT